MMTRSGDMTFHGRSQRFVYIATRRHISRTPRRHGQNTADYAPRGVETSKFTPRLRLRLAA